MEDNVKKLNEAINNARTKLGGGDENSDFGSTKDSQDATTETMWIVRKDMTQTSASTAPTEGAGDKGEDDEDSDYGITKESQDAATETMRIIKKDITQTLATTADLIENTETSASITTPTPIVTAPQSVVHCEETSLLTPEKSSRLSAVMWIMLVIAIAVVVLCVWLIREFCRWQPSNDQRINPRQRMENISYKKVAENEQQENPERCGSSNNGSNNGGNEDNSASDLSDSEYRIEIPASTSDAAVSTKD